MKNKFHVLIGISFFFLELNSVPCSTTVECHGRFIGFGNSIVYIVASCAVVVIVVSTVVMFLACRICSQRSEELRLSRLPEGCDFQHNFISAAMNQRVRLYLTKCTFTHFYIILSVIYALNHMNLLSSGSR